MGQAQDTARRLEAEHGTGHPFAAAIRATRMAMLLTDPNEPDNPIVFANDAFARLTGYGREEVIGRNCRFLQGAETDAQTVARIRDCIRDRCDFEGEILNYRKDGSSFWNGLFICPVNDEAGRLLYFFASQWDITDRVEAAARLQAESERLAQENERVEALVQARTRELNDALKSKTALLYEIDHRVKNNIQLIGSMLRLQMRRVSDGETRQVLMSAISRIEALSSVQRRLYQSDNVSRFDLSGFARDLIEELVGSTGRTDIAVQLDLEPAVVDTYKAAPLAIVLNELVTNALKHAFREGEPGRLGVSIRRSDDRFAIAVHDDGVGMPGQELGPRSFGRSLVDALLEQMRAEVNWRDGDPGTVVEIALPIGELSPQG